MGALATDILPDLRPEGPSLVAPRRATEQIYGKLGKGRDFFSLRRGKRGKKKRGLSEHKFLFFFFESYLSDYRAPDRPR